MTGCRHDGLHRGSEPFFLPSPTKKHADVEQSRWALGPRGPRWDWTKHRTRARVSGCEPFCPAILAGRTVHLRRSVRGGAAVLRASGASLVVCGPARGLTEQGPARVGASRLGLWGEPRQHLSRPVGAEKIAVVLFKLVTGCRGPTLSGHRGRVPSRFSVPHHI